MTISLHVDCSPQHVILSQNANQRIAARIANLNFIYDAKKACNLTVGKNDFLKKFVDGLNPNDFVVSPYEEGNVILVTGQTGHVYIFFKFVSKNGFYLLNATFQATSLEALNEWTVHFDNAVKDIVLGYETYNLKWFYQTASGIDCTVFEEPTMSTISNKAYPYFNEPVTDIIDRYLKSKESVLLVLGEAGVGKTTLIRYIISRYNELNKNAVVAESEGYYRTSSDKKGQVFYTSDTGVLETDDMFISYASSSSSLMVLEDIDLHLTNRTEGNTFMYKLLGASDGLLKNINRKIIISTNLPNIHEVDDALTRKGRCFGVLEFERLTLEQSLDFLVDTNPEFHAILTKHAERYENAKFSLAELYSDEFFLEMERD